MKKILLMAIMFMMFMGVVSASSKNGDFEGNPIVELYGNSQHIKYDDVPAIIYKGRTMVPIYLLKKMGADVTWDQKNYAVSVEFTNLQTTPTPITTPAPNNPVDLEKVFIGFNETAKKYNASNVRLVFNKYGGYIDADVTLSGNFDADNDNIMLTSSFVAKSPVKQMFIDLYENNKNIGYYEISRDDVEKFINNSLTKDGYFKTWKWNPTDVTPTPAPTPVPLPSKPTQAQINESMCKAKIDGFNMANEATKADLISLGIFNESYFNNSVEAGKKKLNIELQQYGCQIN